MTTTYLICPGTPSSHAGRPLHDEPDGAPLPIEVAPIAALAIALRSRGIGAIHCGDSPCCRQTANIIARELRVLVTEHHELRDVSIGNESLPGTIRRIVPIWQSISNAGHTAIVVVAQAGLNRILLGHVLNLPIDDMLRLDQDAGCVNIIERNGTRPWVRLINGTPADLTPENASATAPREPYHHG